MNPLVSLVTEKIELEPGDPASLLMLCGPQDMHLQQISEALTVQINHRSGTLTLVGEPTRVKMVQSVVTSLQEDLENGVTLNPEHVALLVNSVAQVRDDAGSSKALKIVTPKLHVQPRGASQSSYCLAMNQHDINFGIGPAGTGKTFLAVAKAVEALTRDQVRRILLVRPAVEAGEKLGFLPGDLAQKVDPYLRPLYDALYDMLGTETVGRMLEKNQIEVAPLAFMRGRTLNHAFIILDESQNTSPAQMKMFLTRLGFGSTAVVTGDLTQVDLPEHSPCGLAHALNVLQGIKGVSMTRFSSADVVRHPLVQRIVDAYDREKAAG